MEEKIRQLAKELVEKDTELRGPVITLTLEVEELIGEIVECYFCSRTDKRNKFHSLINNSNQMTLEWKIRIFSDVFKSNYSDIAEKYPRLLNRIGELKKLRNGMAHSRLEISSEIFEKGYIDRCQYRYYTAKGERKLTTIQFETWEIKAKEFVKLYDDLKEIKRQVELLEPEPPAEKRAILKAKGSVVKAFGTKSQKQ